MPGARPTGAARASGGSSRARRSSSRGAAPWGADAPPDEAAYPFTVRLALAADPRCHARRSPAGIAASQPGSSADEARLLYAPGGAVGDAVDEARTVVVLDWTDAGVAAYDDPLAAPAKHGSCVAVEADERRERENGDDGADAGVPLESCLDAFGREETLSSEDAWICPRCKVPREAISKIEPWRLPDILVVHVKRFLCSAKWREKIRTKVRFSFPPPGGTPLGSFRR